jgi:hypothetical protein
MYTSFYSSRNPGGSAHSTASDPELYKQQTGFTGFAYYPKSLT